MSAPSVPEITGQLSTLRPLDQKVWKVYTKLIESASVSTYMYYIGYTYNLNIRPILSFSVLFAESRRSLGTRLTNSRNNKIILMQNTTYCGTH